MNFGLLNPFSSDFVWYQVARKVGAAVAASPTGAAPSVLASSVAPDFTFWAALAATSAGGIYLYKRSTGRKKAKRK